MSSDPKPYAAAQQESASPELEVERLRLDAQLRMAGMKADVLKVVFGTMIVGVAVAFFPFAQELAKSWFARSIEEVRTQAEFARLAEQNRLAEQLEHLKFELESKRQEAEGIGARRTYLEQLAGEARSERIERQIVIAEFFSFLGEPEMRAQWEGFRDYLTRKQELLNNERKGLLATATSDDVSSADRATAVERLQQIDRLQNPTLDSAPAYNLEVPPSVPGESRLGRRMLEIAVEETNLGVHEVAQSDRVAQYWASIGMRADRTTPWSAAFVAWVIKQTGNPHDLLLSPNHIGLWRSAETKGFVVARNGAPVPGDIAFRARDRGGLATWKSASGLAPGNSGFVYSLDGSTVTVIAGNASDAVRPLRWRLDDPLLVGFVHLPDSDVEPSPDEGPADP